MTVEIEDAEIHILGYFIDTKAEWFINELKHMQESRVSRMFKMVDLLNKSGIDVKAEDVLKLAGKGTIGRLHLAQAMIKTGKVRNFKDAFQNYIGFLKPCYVPHARFSPKEAIEMLLRAGGVPVLAHPGTMNKDDYIPELVRCGLKGIEVYHTDHKPSVIEKYKKAAEDNGLLLTGGSDCHGMGKGRILIGTVRVPYDLVERLREKSQEIRKSHKPE